MGLKKSTLLLRAGLRARRQHYTRNLGMTTKEQADSMRNERKHLSRKWIRDREIASRHTRNALVKKGQKANIKAGKMP